MPLTNILKNWGLSENEAKVYLAALELGQATIIDLARKSLVKRTTIYSVIEELKIKGLVTETKKGTKTYFVSEDPEKLRESEKDRLKDLEKSLPELKSIFNLMPGKPKVKFYEGEAGLKLMYEDTIKGNDDIVAFSDFEYMLKVMDKDFMWNYPKRRAAKGISFRGIMRRSKELDEFIPLNLEQKREIKFLEKADFSTEINIYGNKVGLMSFRGNLVGVIIEDKNIANTMRIIWQNLWRSLPKSE